MSLSLRKWLPPLFALAALFAPFTGLLPAYWITLFNYIGLSSLVALGLVLLTGVGGMTSFGQAAFVGFGAYTSAVLALDYGVSPWLTLPVSLTVTALGALLIGAVTVRLSGHYLPLGTIAWGIALFYVFGNSSTLGSHDGLSGIPPLRVGTHAVIDPREYFVVVWIAVLLSFVATRNLLDSRIGRAIRALRRGAVAAESFGVNAPRAKLIVFVYSALLAGLAGWLYAHFQRSVSPGAFGVNTGIEYLIMAVIGGAGRIYGAILGAAAVTILKDQLQNILPWIIGSTGNYETIVFGAILVLVLETAPQRTMAADRRSTAPAEIAADAGGAAAAARKTRRGNAPAASERRAEDLRRIDCGERRQFSSRCRRDFGPHRPERRREKHDIRSSDLRHSADERHDRVLRPAARWRAAARRGGARHQPHVPACASRARHERHRECRARRASARRGRRRCAPSRISSDAKKRRCSPMRSVNCSVSGSASKP